MQISETDLVWEVKHLKNNHVTSNIVSDPYSPNRYPPVLLIFLCFLLLVFVWDHKALHIDLSLTQNYGGIRAEPARTEYGRMRP